MHQYRIKITKYTPEGSLLANNYINKYADNPEQAKNIIHEYDVQKYETVNPETGETVVGNKMYKVELFLLCYKLTDKDTFLAQFEA